VPKVSVTIPTKDRLEFLQKAVPMFLGHPEVGEVIIIVDGCKDETLEYVTRLAATDQRVRYIDNGLNKGLPYSRNRGSDLASYDYVFTGEDDLELTNGFFTTLMSHMKEVGADVISPRNIFRFEHETPDDAIRRTDAIDGPAIRRRAITVETGAPASGDRRQILLPAPMLARASLFKEIRFDEEFKVNFWREESDFQFSAIEAGYSLVYCPHAISFNFVIDNDVGGAHAAVGLRRYVWTVRNNWRFANKHRELISHELGIKSVVIYIVRFAIYRFFQEIAIPYLRLVKASLFR